MTTESVILIGGIYNLAFVLFHLMFWKLFHWGDVIGSMIYFYPLVVSVGGSV